MKTSQKSYMGNQHSSGSIFSSIDQGQFLVKILIYYYVFTSVIVRADDAYNPDQDAFNFVMTTFIPFITLYGLYLIKRQKTKRNEKIVKNEIDKSLVYFEGILTDMGTVIACFIVPLIGFGFAEIPINNHRVFIYGSCSSLFACASLITYFWLIEIFAHKSFKHLRDRGHLLQYNILLTIPFAIMDIFYIIFAFSVDNLNIKIIVFTYYGISLICKTIAKIKFGHDRIKFLKYVTLLSLLAYLVFTCYLSAVFLSTNFYQTQFILLIVTLAIFRIFYYFDEDDEDEEDEEDEDKNENGDSEDDRGNNYVDDDEETGNTNKDEKRCLTHGYINFLMSFKRGDERRKYKFRPTLFIWIACIVIPFTVFIPVLL
ncbi:hypothetical protein C1645_835145 [Glomus cerebriforme]|uniref:Uncharacterized protein n=1 Tax=Glomus cerebriforme TaxID=658196 RepID=A0A397SEB4_9GLOM|nr:hypothetical protein C1645_835145 [Glomus cerebriforme]